mmetsp:Transcript_6770/g.23637  ORF Transcript_6770/g.23637 Transcript_6770/m.23637 type:complete len:215 (+) Transcript_6770:855-1499(+)
MRSSSVYIIDSGPPRARTQASKPAEWLCGWDRTVSCSAMLSFCSSWSRYLSRKLPPPNPSRNSSSAVLSTRPVALYVSLCDGGEVEIEGTRGGAEIPCESHHPTPAHLGRIGENLVRALDMLELLLVAALVRVLPRREVPVRPANLLLRGSLVEAQHVVEVGELIGGDHDCSGCLSPCLEAGPTVIPTSWGVAAEARARSGGLSAERGEWGDEE